MMRSEARRARNAGEPARTLWEADYLLLVDDETRQGALRFAVQESGPFVRGIADHRTPPLIELPALLAASEHVYDEVETEEDLRLLLAPGSTQRQVNCQAQHPAWRIERAREVTSSFNVQVEMD